MINTGTELTLGHVTNSHLVYLAQSLFGLGMRVTRQVTVPDGEEIKLAFQTAITRAHIIILTGGLGPTSDDITRDVVSAVMDKPLEFDPAIWAGLEAYFAGRGRKMTDMQKKQAMVPKGGIVLPNPAGTAPGLFIPFEGPDYLPGVVILLPGPPRELQVVWEKAALPLLQERFQAHLLPLHEVQLRMVGIGESTVEMEIEEAVRKLGVTEVGYCARPGEVDLRLIGPEAAVHAAANLAREKFREQIYTEGQVNMEELVNELARAKKKTVAVVESCTGGYIANRITNVPCSSEMFRYGWVTYANEAKITELGVPPATIEAHGAVSAAVAQAMAEGALARSEADLALSVTGIAGPGGGTPEKPVGLVFLGLAQTGKPSEVLERKLFGNRETFKYMASQLGLNMIRRALLAM